MTDTELKDIQKYDPIDLMVAVVASDLQRRYIKVLEVDAEKLDKRYKPITKKQEARLQKNYKRFMTRPEFKQYIKDMEEYQDTLKVLADNPFK